MVGSHDLVSDAELAEAEAIVKREARAGIALVRGQGGNLSPELLLGLSAASESDMIGRESHHELEGEEHDHDDFASFVVEPAAVPSIEDIRARVTAALIVPGVLRVKGRVGVENKSGTAVIQAVGARVETYFSPESEAPRLVVIGLRDMDRGAIEAALGC